MSKFKVGDMVELKSDFNCPLCCPLEGVIAEVINPESEGPTLYKINWDPTWTFADDEIQLWEEPNGN